MSGWLRSEEKDGLEPWGCLVVVVVTTTITTTTFNWHIKQEVSLLHLTHALFWLICPQPLHSTISLLHSRLYLSTPSMSIPLF